MPCRLFLSRRVRVNSAVTAVVTDAAASSLAHPVVVNVVGGVDVYVIYRRVVKELSIIPASALIPTPEVTETIVDSAIESY
jgi:hypothetical protein